MSEVDLDRRAMCQLACRATGATFIVGVTTMLSACMPPKYVSGHVEAGRLRLAKSVFTNGDWITVDAPDTGELPIFVRRTGIESFEAFSSRCTHRGCQTTVAGNKFVCPCHGSEFSFAGIVLEGPAERPLRRFDVRLDDTHVYILLGEKPEGAS